MKTLENKALMIIYRKDLTLSAEISETGHAPNIICGLAVGMESVVLPLLCICVAIFVSAKFLGIYGIPSLL